MSTRLIQLKDAFASSVLVTVTITVSKDRTVIYEEKGSYGYGLQKAQDKIINFVRNLTQTNPEHSICNFNLQPDGTCIVIVHNQQVRNTEWETDFQKILIRASKNDTVDVIAHIVFGKAQAPK